LRKKYFTSLKVFHGEQSPEHPSPKNQPSTLKTHNALQKRLKPNPEAFREQD